MDIRSYKIFGSKVIIQLRDRICENAEELILSAIFRDVLTRSITALQKRKSKMLNIFHGLDINDKSIDTLVKTLQYLTKLEYDQVISVVPESKSFLEDVHLFSDFIEFLYDFWRNYERYIICDSEGESLDRRPYRTFNSTIEQLTDLVRRTYRDVEENLTKTHPRSYRQTRAGANVGVIALPVEMELPAEYAKLNKIPVIRQILSYPPTILWPPMNKRTGRFMKIDKNPIGLFEPNPDDWLCYPAKVGKLLVMIYFNEKFYELGFSLANLFELADDKELKRKPDAVYTFGVPGDCLDGLSEYPTVFFDDEANGLLSAAVPNRDEFGYFGYLKKMVLTLHNIRIMKEGKLPYHGALVKIVIDNKETTILLIGDTGAGKSEGLEAFRQLGEDVIQDMIIIADDMGSLDIDTDRKIIGYGTEIGAFLRLDDLQPGYAFGQLDRAIIMSPNKVNARIVLPVTSFNNVISGNKIDMVLYANNYEELDEFHDIIEKFETPDEALKVFREGAVMSKGTTTSTGLTHSYFANIFGPPQYRELHDKIASEYFRAFFDAGVFVGQIRTRLGVSGMEMKGPEESAKALLELIRSL
jgi:hypothetical protein